MAVMEEVHNQMGEIAAKQKDKIDELSAEIRKLKAMIVKHESRYLLNCMCLANLNFFSYLSTSTESGHLKPKTERLVKTDLVISTAMATATTWIRMKFRSATRRK